MVICIYHETFNYMGFPMNGWLLVSVFVGRRERASETMTVWFGGRDCQTCSSSFCPTLSHLRLGINEGLFLYLNNFGLLIYLKHLYWCQVTSSKIEKENIFCFSITITQVKMSNMKLLSLTLIVATLIIQSCAKMEQPMRSKLPFMWVHLIFKSWAWPYKGAWVYETVLRRRVLQILPPRLDNTLVCGLVQFQIVYKLVA